MTALTIIAGILLLLLLFSLSRFRVCIEYNGEFVFNLKYLFFTFRMKSKQTGKAKKKPKQKSAGKLTLDQIRAFLDLFKRFQEDAEKVFRKLKKRMRIDNLHIELTIGGDDPAQTAMTYGEACAVLFPAVTALGEFIAIKRRQVCVTPQFGGENKIVFRCRVSIRVGSAIAFGVAGTVKIILSLIKNPADLARIRQRGAVKNE